MNIGSQTRRGLLKITGRWFMALAILAVLVPPLVGAARADVAPPSKFTNQGSVANTRHNMMQRQASGGGGSPMDPYRNDYGEVCVYCHTPHGANSDVALPLWNRTVKATVYTTYDALGTSSLTQRVTQPGPNSLTCLSCHDGQVAIDSIINMPGAGGYSSIQSRMQDDSFLNGWNSNRGGGAVMHLGLNPVPSGGCLACHSGGTLEGLGAPNFSVFVIGTDLRNDHPVGVRFPTAGAGTDYNPTTAARLGMSWFDTNGNHLPDSSEVRLYDTGDGVKVECASCHDPHGVPSFGAGSVFNPSFLRIRNTGSALCLTCHIK